MSTPGAKDRKSQSLTIAVSLRMRGKGEIQTQFQYFLLFIPSFWLAESQRRQERKAATVLALEAKLEPERTLSKSLPFLQYSSKKKKIDLFSYLHREVRKTELQLLQIEKPQTPIYLQLQSLTLQIWRKGRIKRVSKVEVGLAVRGDLVCNEKQPFKVR